MKNKALKYFVIGTFVSLYLVVSIISTIHVVQFFDLTNPKWLSVSLAIAFELGAAASLASIIALDKMNKFLVWSLFVILTAMQAMGNTYYAYINIEDFKMWSELFGLIEEDIIFQKRILSIISGAILPLVALGFIKSLVDYIKPEENSESYIDQENSETNVESKEDTDNTENEISDTVIDLEDSSIDNVIQSVNQEDSQPLPENNSYSDDAIPFVNYNSEDSTQRNTRNEYLISRSKWRPRG